MRLFPVLLTASLLAVPAWGAAFSIHELGGRAAGMGGAFVAVASDGSALFYNPAGIAFQEGFRMEMDMLVVNGQFRLAPSFAPPGTVVPDKGFDGYIHPRAVIVPNMYMTKTLRPKWTLGFGVFAPFGLGANWTNFRDSDPQNTKFAARYVNNRSKMLSIWFQPTVAYRINKRTSVAVGVAFVHTYAMIEQSILNPYEEGKAFGEVLAPQIFPGYDPTAGGAIIARFLPEGRARFAGVSNKPGVAGGFLHVVPRWRTRFGFSYRSAIAHHFEGKASFAFTDNYTLKPLAPQSTFYGLFPNQNALVEFPTPATYSVGVATEAFGRNLFSADLQFQDYRRMKYVVQNFTQTAGTGTPAESRLEFDFRNVFAIRVGWERQIKKFVARAGWSYDKTPVPDKSVSPLWPDSSRFNFTAGVSKQLGSREITLFYQAMHYLNRTTNVPANKYQFTNGEYRNFANLFGLSLRFRVHGGDLGFR